MAKILVIKLGALGDVVMATALLRQIQAHHHGDELVLLTSPPFAGIFESWPNLEVKALPRKGLLSALRTMAWIRAQGFDRLYDLQSNDRTRLYTALSGIAERVGNHPGYPYTLSPPQPYAGECHIFARMNQVLAAAGLAPAEPEVWLPLDDLARQEVKDWLLRQRLTDQSFVIMHAGASVRHPAKCWPYYGDLADALYQRQITTVWIGGQGDMDSNRALSRRCGIDASACFSINQLAELARHAHFAVTNDSGPMHALSGSGIPVYAFFGPTNWKRNHALGQAERVITLQGDEVTGKTQCGAEAQLKNISCDAVLERLDRDGLLG